MEKPDVKEIKELREQIIEEVRENKEELPTKPDLEEFKKRTQNALTKTELKREVLIYGYELVLSYDILKEIGL